jgi:hypothetical protein
MKEEFILLTGGNTVISSKGGIPKIWGETLLLLLLGIDINPLNERAWTVVLSA